MPQIVTDPGKIVTDPVVISQLQKAGKNYENWEFYQDYASRSLGKEHSPFAKFYRNTDNLHEKIMVVSGLPMVDADGVKIEAGWRVAGINYFSEKNNLFWAKVQGTDIELRVRNDQPDGRKANDRLSYKPQLFLNGVEQACGQSTLLSVDPVNPNYLENTLEWNYGICKRRLRIIEGNILGSWVFAQKPSGEVRIKYNQSGDYRLKLGQFKVNNDEEIVKPEDFDRLATEFNQGYPITISDSATYYPDPHTETTSVDGYARRDIADPGQLWADFRAAAGIDAYDNEVSGNIVFAQASSTTNQWKQLRRPIILFDTSGLPDDATVSDAVLSMYATAAKVDDLVITPDINIYSSNPASNIALAAADFNIANWGSTDFATAITWANWTINQYNAFTFVAAGIAAIKKTAADPISKFGIRSDPYDSDGTAPTWSNNLNYAGMYFAEQGTVYKPKLVVTYSTVTNITITLAATMDSTGADTSPASLLQADVVSAMVSTGTAITPVSSIQADVATAMASIGASTSPLGMITADVPSAMLGVGAFNTPSSLIEAIVQAVFEANALLREPQLIKISPIRYGTKLPSRTRSGNASLDGEFINSRSGSRYG